MSCGCERRENEIEERKQKEERKIEQKRGRKKNFLDLFVPESKHFLWQRKRMEEKRDDWFTAPSREREKDAESSIAVLSNHLFTSAFHSSII